MYPVLNRPDVIIRGGLIIDGTGAAPFRGDIGITGGVITSIGDLHSIESQQSIVVDKAVVAPGFIDTHSHSDLIYLANQDFECKVRQGITTEILGQDGLGVTPVNVKSSPQVRSLVKGLLGDVPGEWSWSDINSYVRELLERGVPNNCGLLVPHGTVRVLVKGMQSDYATRQELDAMEGIVRDCMEQKALGLSTGLYYSPCNFADKQELVALTRVVGLYGGGLVVHMRSESDRILAAIEEVCDICVDAGAWLHISHFKIVGASNWGGVRSALEVVGKYEQRGLRITMDQYPYTAGTTGLLFRLPPWVLEGGVSAAMERLRLTKVREQIKEDVSRRHDNWENRILIVGWDNHIISSLGRPENKGLIGKSIGAISKEKRSHPVDVICDLLVAEGGAISVITHFACEEDLIEIMRHRFTMFCTDGIIDKRPHPRVYGAFPRVLAKYVREEQILTLSEAIRKMTSLPASTFRLMNRGKLEIGMAGDVVIFDPEKIKDTATYEHPAEYPLGIEWVLVNGRVVVSPGGGKVSRGNGRFAARAN